MRNGSVLHLAIQSSCGKFGSHTYFGILKLSPHDESAPCQALKERAYSWHSWNLCISQSSAGVASPQV